MDVVVVILLTLCSAVTGDDKATPPPVPTAPNGLPLCAMMEGIDGYFTPLYDQPAFARCMREADMADVDFLASSEPPSEAQLELFFHSSSCRTLYSALLRVLTEEMPLCAIDRTGTSIKTLGDKTFDELQHALLTSQAEHGWMTSFNL
ncbi:hypothetical protein SDRG_14572 [Saprolegnia diclina VS20]|uniref:Secreted protein n=1 Tax=Saprolegnia diclina (strain VS20) TaxID=1156394 RepID=T0Q2K2_SAPDV|nr:hypothetical protein SDRG_14541 [Saprolegnia diclina VS20]XP_008618932.1 hypothetical protein SDRG_14572 [Saprolegnia diclina VS20]EQC27630.1 hypothetical protein SDRG_14541 [Saprolegnia diclina VS20]EQC27664.1 hypothetical protein SDRG_14572 [Saprolegnia diclina VS20]|eukprot:XP_008618898.1 hypothetical protein SDRG_14541 [Saprolegnia diclina VS20]